MKDVIELAKQAGASTERVTLFPPTFKRTIEFNVDQLEKFATLVRNAALEQAKQLFSQPHQEYFGREAQDAIESLKEPTP